MPLLSGKGCLKRILAVNHIRQRICHMTAVTGRVTIQFSTDSIKQKGGMYDRQNSTLP